LEPQSGLNTSDVLPGGTGNHSVDPLHRSAYNVTQTPMEFAKGLKFLPRHFNDDGGDPAMLGADVDAAYGVRVFLEINPAGNCILKP
jgi:hypothetical protein